MGDENGRNVRRKKQEERSGRREGEEKGRHVRREEEEGRSAGKKKERRKDWEMRKEGM